MLIGFFFVHPLYLVFDLLSNLHVIGLISDSFDLLQGVDWVVLFVINGLGGAGLTGKDLLLILNDFHIL